MQPLRPCSRPAEGNPAFQPACRQYLRTRKLAKCCVRPLSAAFKALFSFLFSPPGDESHSFTRVIGHINLCSLLLELRTTPHRRMSDPLTIYSAWVTPPLRTLPRFHLVWAKGCHGLKGPPKMHVHPEPQNVTLCENEAFQL